MADNGFNGTTVTFPSTSGRQTELRSVTDADSPAEVQISGSTSATHQYVPGLSDPSYSIEICGGSTVAIGSTGSCVVKWFNGETSTLGSAILMAKEKSGSVDAEILSSLTFRPTD